MPCVHNVNVKERAIPFDLVHRETAHLTEEMLSAFCGTFCGGDPELKLI